jgi:hypothetical protein
MTQKGLFDEPEKYDRGAARRSDPDTSKAAAKSTNASRLEGIVLKYLRSIKPFGATSREISEKVHIDFVSICPRLRPMERKGLVKDSGRRADNPSGKKAIVWVAI